MMNRRAWLVAGAAGVGVAAGVGWALHRETADPPLPDDFWALRFPAPDQGELALADLRGRPIVLNFWATWCPPCLREMPALDRFQQAWRDRGWQVVGLALDAKAPVQEFLHRTPVSFRIGLAGFGGSDLLRRLGNANGALPYTVLISSDGRLFRRQLGETSEAELERWAREHDGGQAKG